jgi:hypothetical protein
MSIPILLPVYQQTSKPNERKPHSDDPGAVRPASRQEPADIGKLAKAGILVMRGRLVDAAASDAVLDDKPDDAPVGQQPTTFAQARLAREVFSAKLKKLEYETRIG